MAQKNEKMTLVDGEEVIVSINSVCNQEQTFVRINQNLIAGIVNDSSWDGIYIWQEVNGIYERLGDITFHENDDKTILWRIYAWTHNTKEFSARAASFLAKQGKIHGIGSSGNCMEMLSAAPSRKVK